MNPHEHWHMDTGKNGLCCCWLALAGIMTIALTAIGILIYQIGKYFP